MSPPASGARGGLSIGVIVPDLRHDGGAERMALECVRHWQERHRITLYSVHLDEAMLARHGIGRRVARRRLSEQLERETTASGLEGWVLQGALRPRIWALELDEHDVYLGHQWPCHRIDRHPLVWYAHELHRFSYDLGRELPSGIVEARHAALLDPGVGLRSDRQYDAAYGFLRELDTTAQPERVVANSHFTASQVARALGRDDIDVVHPGVDLSAGLEPTWDEPMFLSVGRLLLHKRHRLAIEAISLVEGARLVLVGRGPRRGEIEEVAARLGVEDRVEVRSDVDDAELSRLYAACRAVVFTSIREPFGMVALEALAAGKPLVAVDEGGFTELVDGSCAMLLPPEPGAFAEALAYLLAEPEKAEHMGRAGAALARTRSWERTARELEAILEAVAHEPRPPPAPARPATPDRREGPWVGARLLIDYGDGAARGRWRRGAARDMPRSGHYASHHASTLRRQLAEIEGCGLDFVVLALAVGRDGPEPYAVEALVQALALAPELGRAARFAVELVVEDPDEGTLARTLAWLASVLPRSDAMLREGGRPLVLVGGATPGAGSAPAVLSLRSTSDRAVMWLPTAALEDPAPLAREVRRALAEPGLDWIVLASWNDHAEGNPIEPTLRRGDHALRQLAACLADARTGRPRHGES